MAQTMLELLAALNTLMSGHTDRREEAQIVSLLEETDAAQLNELLMTSDLRNLLTSVDDRVLGDDNRTKLYDLLTIRRLPALQVGTRVALVDLLQQGRTGRQEEEALCNVFLGTQGSDLTVLKNAIDAGDDYRDLQQLLLSDLDDSEIRKKILVHLERQGQANPCQVVKALSDIDDTFYANLKDKRYLKRTTYPGVVPVL